jgi:hypothetical protein
MIRLILAFLAIVLNALTPIMDETTTWVTRLYVSAMLGSFVAMCIEEYQMDRYRKAMLKRWEEREKNEPNNI